MQMADSTNPLQEVDLNEIDFSILLQSTDDNENKLKNAGGCRNYNSNCESEQPGVVQIAGLKSNSVGIANINNLDASSNTIVRTNSDDRLNQNRVPVSELLSSVLNDPNNAAVRSQTFQNSQLPIKLIGVRQSSPATNVCFDSKASLVLPVASVFTCAGIVASLPSTLLSNNSQLVMSAGEQSTPVLSSCSIISGIGQARAVHATNNAARPAILPTRAVLPPRPVLAPRVLTLPTVLANQAGIRIALQPQQQQMLQRINIPQNGIQHLLPGTVLMKNQQGQLMLVQQGQPLNGTVVSANVLQTPGAAAFQQNGTRPVAVSGTASIVPQVVQLSNQQQQSIVGIRPVPLSLQSQVSGVASRPPGCMLLQAPASAAVAGVSTNGLPAGQLITSTGLLPRPVLLSGTAASSGVTGNNIVIPTTQMSTGGIIVRPALSTGNFIIRTPISSGMINPSAIQVTVTTGQTFTGRPASPHVVVSNGIQMPLANNDGKQVQKVKNFFSTLLKLAGNETNNMVQPITALIQKLIDGQLEPEQFTAQIQTLLKSAPQPDLVVFLKVTLPMLRRELLNNRVQIEGIRPPPASLSCQPLTQPFLRPQANALIQQLRGMGVLTQQRTPLQTSIPILSGVMPALTTGPAVQVPRLLSTPGASLPVGSLSFTKPVVAQITAGMKRKHDLLRDDDDINDVAAMGGVNLLEESRHIMASNSAFLSDQLRSCTDRTFLDRGALAFRIRAIVMKNFGVDGSGSSLLNFEPEAVSLVAHAVEQRIRTILQRLSVVTEHRLEIYKNDPMYEVTSETKQQLKFLADVEALEKKRHEDSERVALMKAAKSRSKSENPEHQRLKEKGKALQQAEMEQLHQKEANLTALAAIGPRRIAMPGHSLQIAGTSSSTSNHSSAARANRIKRANLRDLIFVMESDQHLRNSPLLFRYS